MKDFIWNEIYRPSKVEDCILPSKLKKNFLDIVASGEVPNMLLTGTAGLGKTTVAKAICKELKLDYIMINGSEDGNIETLRGKIRQFASSISLTGGYKVVILDEADYLNPQSTQPALRGFIEEFHKNCRFILTCNFKNKIIEPLHSRCGVYEFNTTKQEMAILCGQFFERLKGVLGSEGIEYHESQLPDLIMKYAPDWRRIIGEVQRFSVDGKLDVNFKKDGGEYKTLTDILKAQDFKKMRRWVVDNIDVDTAAIFRGLYDSMNSVVKPHSIPQLVLILADYQYKNAFVADHELNIVACMTEIMANVEFI